MTRESCLYVGTVRHRRRDSVRHAFTYPLFMAYLDLGELDHVFQKRWLWSVDKSNVASFWRKDHLGDANVPLDVAVRDLVAQQTGERPTGPIRLLTHLRYFGYGFNPVSFYYCFEPDGRTLQAVVAEVNNTPWGEQHAYVLPSSASRRASGRWRHYQLAKEFHVSPFMDMNIRYDWALREPGSDLGVHMTSVQNGERIFDATLWMNRRPLNGVELARVLFSYPLMTLQVIAGIYWQALRLRLKGAPSFAHPDKRLNQSEVDA